MIRWTRGWRTMSRLVNSIMAIPSEIGVARSFFFLLAARSRAAALRFISGNDPLDQGVAHDVAFGEFDNGDPFRDRRCPLILLPARGEIARGRVALHKRQ